MNAIFIKASRFWQFKLPVFWRNKSIMFNGKPSAGVKLSVYNFSEEVDQLGMDETWFEWRAEPSSNELFGKFVVWAV